uniref:Response regulator transcription factor n=1 Tax=Roseihalotalea indica TaxID=2867963 RepID=A0AA49GR73_9BACT|nr:response regulator transcription factor [Tunicatimonas sp. TK19036]
MKIIIADDHLLYRKGVVDYIKDCFPEATVEEANDGVEVLSLAKHFQPDIAILDLEMPKMDGVDTINYLKLHYPDVKILIMSMHQNELLMREVIALGVNGYLVKGENEKDLKIAIETLLDDKSYFSQTPIRVMQEELKLQSKFWSNFEKLRHLTDREIQVLKLICREMTNKEIADSLHISPRTVDNHRNSLLEKCAVKNTAGLVKFAIQHSLVDTAH